MQLKLDTIGLTGGNFPKHLCVLGSLTAQKMEVFH